MPAWPQRIPVTDLSIPALDPALLDQATQLLLAPAALEFHQLSRVLADIHGHRIDYADLYFQYSRVEAWSLEEGIVKSGSFSIDRGVGVRAVTGERTAFAYSDDISLEALAQAASATRAIAQQGQSAVAALERGGNARALYGARGDDDCGPWPRMAWDPAARGDRAWARGRLQSQRNVGVFESYRAAGCGSRRDRGRRRHDPGSPRLAQHRRRRQPHATDRAHRRRHSQVLYAGHAQCASHGRAADGERSPRVVCARPDAANDQYGHAEWRSRS